MEDFKRSKLGSLLDLDAKAIGLYREAADLKAKGGAYWRPSADALVQAAEAYGKLKMKVVSACLYTEAAETYLRIDKTDAIKAYKSSINLFCDLGRFDLAGRLERKIADICYDNKHWEESAHYYKRAANFLSGEMLLDQCDTCFLKAAECFIRLREMEEARAIYESVATSCVKTNLRRFNAKKYLLMAILCAIAVEIDISVEEYKSKSEMKNSSKHSSRHASRHGRRATEEEDESDDEKEDLTDFRTESERKYDLVEDLCNRIYIEIDFMWKGSVERKFVRNILTARVKGDSHAFIDHVYHYQLARPMEQFLLQLLKVPMDEFPKEAAVIKFKEEERRKEAERQYHLALLASSGSLAKMLEKEAEKPQGSTSMATNTSDGERTSKNMSLMQEQPRQSSIGSNGSPTGRTSFT